MDNKVSVSSVIKLAGAFVAYNIGSGYATGQEIMQFYTSFGLVGSIGAAIISMAIFAWVVSYLMKTGYEIEGNDPTKVYYHFFGKTVGSIFEWFGTIFLFAVVVIMISGAGATFNEYYGISANIGALIMTALVLIAFLLGLNKIVDVIGLIGPVIIVFTIAVGIIALTQNPDAISHADEMLAQNPIAKSTSNWAISGILYAAYPMAASVPFFVALGARANSLKESSFGGILGAVSFMGATIVMNLALLINIDKIFDKEVPMLVLTDNISPVIGTIFSILILMGIFSTAAPMFWIVLNKFTNKSKSKKNSNILAIVFAVVAFCCGQLPFGVLVGTVYPYTGYIGIVVIIWFVYRHVTGKKESLAVPE